MANSNEPASLDTSGTPVVGIRSDVYERQWELIWMTNDDIEHFESRIKDKQLFQSLALFFLSASAPLLFEKGLDYNASKAPVDLAIVVGCGIFVGIGILFQCLAINRRKRITAFRNQLFQKERKLSTTLTMVDASSSSSEYIARGAA